MAPVRLDPGLLQKLSDKTEKSKQYLREQISRKASKKGISSEAVLVLWAKQEGLGIARFLRKLPAEVRAEVRNGSATAAMTTAVPARLPERYARKKEQPITGAAIDSLLQDEQLRERCRDLLLPKKHFDRVLREATTVLDSRLKTKSGITNMNPVNLIGKVLNPDPQKAVLVVSQEKEEQEGWHAICKGVMLVFRNPAHHSLSDKFSREDALKFCGLIDTILGAIDRGDFHPERV